MKKLDKCKVRSKVKEVVIKDSDEVFPGSICMATLANHDKLLVVSSKTLVISRSKAREIAKVYSRFASGGSI